MGSVRSIVAGGGLVAIAVVAVLLVLELRDDPETDVIRWVDAPIGDDNLGRPVAPNIPRIPGGATACSSRNVRLRLHGPTPVNSVITGYAVSLENQGAEACVLRGPPAVVVERRGPGPLGLQEASVSTPGYPAAAPAFGLHSGRTAWAELVLSEDCRSARIRRRRAVVRIGLPQAASVRLTLLSCRSGATLSVSPWQPPPRREPPPATFPLAANLDVPAPAVAGRPFEFRVRLTNASGDPFRFPFCPSYAAGIDGGDGNVGALNCRPVGTLAPGGSVTFAMRIDVSRHFTAGRHALGWRLIGELDDRRVQAAAPIQIRRPGRAQASIGT